MQRSMNLSWLQNSTTICGTKAKPPFQDNRIAEFRDLPFMRARIDEFFPHIFIAISARIVGFVVAHDGRLLQLFVDTNARGHGLGAELLKLAEAKITGGRNSICDAQLHQRQQCRAAFLRTIWLVGY